MNPSREGRTIESPLSKVRAAGRPGTRKECVRAMRDPLPHVLVVDDDPSIREALGAALGHAYAVHAAATGDEACAVLRRHQIAVIILDVVLGREQGLDLVERFRARSPAPILVLTGHGSEAVAARALRVKASEYLKKPVNLVELRAALTRLTATAEPATDPVERARALITEEPGRAHTTESLARQVGLSERHLRRRFFETYAKTPRRYLAEVRLERAAELLRSTSLGIEQIALRVGYPSGIRFTRVFKRSFGSTPSAFRAQRPAPGAAESL